MPDVSVFMIDKVCLLSDNLTENLVYLRHVWSVLF